MNFLILSYQIQVTGLVGAATASQRGSLVGSRNQVEELLAQVKLTHM